MKRIVLTAAAAVSLLLCGCENKNSSLTESQMVSGTTATTETTKATSLTIASQQTTQKTDFTKKDMYHTEREGQDEVQEMCKFIARKWAEVYNGGESFDFSPYCEYEQLAKYLDYHAKYSEKKHRIITDNVIDMQYTENENGDTVTASVLCSDDTDRQCLFLFLIQSDDKDRLKICDMLVDDPYLLDYRLRLDQLNSLDPNYWAVEGRYSSLLEQMGKNEFKASSASGLNDSDKEKIAQLCNYIANGWTLLANGMFNAGIAPDCKYEQLYDYLRMSRDIFATDGGSERHYDPQEVEIIIKDIRLSGNYATVDASLSNKGENERFVFIVENVGGKLLLNDMIFDHERSYDRRYRVEQIKDPKPDYWSDTSRFDKIKKKMEE